MEGMGRLQSDTRKNARETYPLNKGATTPKEPEWPLGLEEWGGEKIGDIEHPRKKRNALQQEIARREQQMRRQQRHRQQLETIIAWREAARYRMGYRR